VACWDDSKSARDSARASGLDVADLATADWSRFAALVLAPGVPLTHPQPHWTVCKANAARIAIIGDIELFFRERARHCPDSPVIVVTGTNGKSTTTALIAHILRAAGKDVQLGGNIGTAILSLEPPAFGRYHVIEMSSFQIDLTPSLRPSIGILLNLSPDHLDRHGTMQAYAAIKERVVACADTAFVGVDDGLSQAIAAKYATSRRPQVHAASAQRHIESGYCLEGDRVIAASSGEVLGSVAGIATLRGRHNAQNAVIASAAARSCGVDPAAIAAALRSFPGLPHRLEEVGRLGQVLFINDSKATNADSTEKALAVFDRDIFWILGGQAKEGGITSLEPYFPRIAKAYLIGEASEPFALTLEGKVAFERCGTLDAAVPLAATDAAASGGPQPVVLLSPACASYDQFKSFEQRGDRFRQLVTALPGASTMPRPAA
jgi:UDP-N-acetylmuramoylalanine--D-glutamate ligase